MIVVVQCVCSVCIVEVVVDETLYPLYYITTTAVSSSRGSTRKKRRGKKKDTKKVQNRHVKPYC